MKNPWAELAKALDELIKVHSCKTYAVLSSNEFLLNDILVDTKMSNREQKVVQDAIDIVIQMKAIYASGNKKEILSLCERALDVAYEAELLHTGISRNPGFVALAAACEIVDIATGKWYKDDYYTTQERTVAFVTSKNTASLEWVLVPGTKS